jgi:aspartyl-tRNA(Asn)/glutamyl-tRNA(Gln) amidotransferase subunit A
MTLAVSADQSGETIRRQADEGLELTRSRPLPASPSAHNHEPDAYSLRMLSYRHSPPKLTPLTDAPDAVPSSGDRRPTVSGLLHSFRTGSRTPSQALAEYLARWKDSPSTESAILAAIPGATEAALRSDHRWEEGNARPLEGIPFGVKDIIDVRGADVTCGSLQTGDRVADTDAEVINRLRAVGAIPVAMTATTEFAMGAAHNARYGVVPNPWDRDRWTGGSSTGSGAGLAAGLFPFALGTDTGGSIRIPSAFCGVTGLKPTNGRVPRTGVATLSWSLDHVGPMGLSAADLRLVLQAMDGQASAAGGNLPSAASGQQNVPSKPLEGVALGVLGGWHEEPIDAEVAASFAAALDTLRSLGATVKQLETPRYEPALAHVEAWNIFYGEVAATQEANLATAHLYDSGTRDRFEEGRRVAAIDYLRGLRRRTDVLNSLLEPMDEADVDFLVLPTTLAAAPQLSDMTMSVNGTAMNIHDILPRNTRIFDYTGLPALALPMGLNSNGLPLSLQIVGRPWSDFDVLGVGEAFQSTTAFHLQSPPEPC